MLVKLELGPVVRFGDDSPVRCAQLVGLIVKLVVDDKGPLPLGAKFLSVLLLQPIVNKHHNTSCRVSRCLPFSIVPLIPFVLDNLVVPKSSSPSLVESFQ